MTKEKESKFPTSEKFNDGKIYQKIGRRYYAVRDIHAYDGLGNGSWLVVVDNGCTSIRQSLTPDTAAVEAAFKIAEEKLVKILAKASEAKLANKSIPMTKREQKAWKAYTKVMGKERTLCFEYDSLYDMAQNILEELRQESKQSPVAFDAYSPYRGKIKEAYDTGWFEIPL